MTATQYREYVKAKPHVPTKKKVSNKAVREMELLLKIEGVEFVKEYRFHPTRKWRFDFAIVEKKIALEFEGGVFHGKSRHTTGKGFTEDAAKYNEAAKLGWKVLRYTAKGYSKLIEDLKQIL
jgi:very-short-patch-repair endonuclease